MAAFNMFFGGELVSSRAFLSSCIKNAPFPVKFASVFVYVHVNLNSRGNNKNKPKKSHLFACISWHDLWVFLKNPIQPFLNALLEG